MRNSWRYATFITFFMLLASSSLLAQNMREEVRRARQVYRRHQYANAEVAYRKALSKDSTFTEARFGLAGTQYAQGRTDEALQNYAALVQDPTLTPKRRAELMHNLGNSFMKKKDYRQSVEAYKHSLRINPTDEETRYNLALAMKLLQKQQQQGGGGDNQDQNKENNHDKKQPQNNPNNNNQGGQQQPQPSKQDNTQKDQQPRQNEMSRESAEKILKAYEQDEEKTREKVEQMRKQRMKQQKGNSTKQW
ncbi:tetratricopeptide repeat protein [Porphyromonas gingivalis]|uniref:tetratricopeptide repeat protein n=1 Tax=Porphyromonas gingivalis TaxID=837 RepID=UPI001F2ACA0D|nr:tetratricopeptide repeat protein [Porphyromonas gingivalis]MCE8172577.1 tetratricopeptide repeat protein [Porphyromonas gingivalis]